MAEQATKYVQLFPIHHIPYGLDTKTYQPLDSEQCRSLLEIPTGKKSFDVCSEKLNDPRKGGDLTEGSTELTGVAEG